MIQNPNTLTEGSTGQRIKKLRIHYNLSMKDFATECGLSHVAIFHMESGKTVKPHRSTLQRMASVFGTTVDWISQGKNEMLQNGTKELYDKSISKSDASWKEDAYLEIKSKNAMLEKEVERLWSLLNHFTNGKKMNLEQVRDVG